MQRKQYLFKLVKTITISLALVISSGCGLFPSEEEALVPPLAVPEEVTYKTVEVKVGHIEESIKGKANFVPYGEKSIFFENSSGRLKKLYVKAGDSVKKGSIIAELLTENIERQIANQEIIVNSKQKDLEYTKSISDIEIKMSEDELKELQKKYDTMTKISDTYPKNEVDSVRIQLENQKNILQKLKLNWSNQLEIKKNDLESAKLTLQGLKEDFENSRLLSPFDAVVTYTASIKEGEFVDAFKTIATIAKPGDLQLKYKGMDAVKFELGMPVEVTTDNNIKCTGEVIVTQNSVPAEEIEKYNETVLIKLDKVPDGVKSGSSADIKLVLKSSDNALIIPKNAVKKYMGKDTVYILDNNIRVERNVVVGIESTNEVQIIEGVEAGEKVIVE
jgi:multidrug efflux pump subunit AcrA (membrane-fusion protein)